MTHSSGTRFILLGFITPQVVDTDELRRGLAASRGYLLSHHLPGERYRCYAPALFGRRVHLCARCLGIYPGIVAGLAAFGLAPDEFVSVVLVAVLPIPALVDWTVTAFSDRRGSNVVRTATGGLLGYAYGVGLPTLVLATEPSVLLIGCVYALAAGCLVALERRVTANRDKLFTGSS